MTKKKLQDEEQGKDVFDTALDDVPWEGTLGGAATFALMAALGKGRTARLAKMIKSKGARDPRILENAVIGGIGGGAGQHLWEAQNKAGWRIKTLDEMYPPKRKR